jgi:hypothetical protein
MPKKGSGRIKTEPGRVPGRSIYEPIPGFKKGNDILYHTRSIAYRDAKALAAKHGTPNVRLSKEKAFLSKGSVYKVWVRAK